MFKTKELGIIVLITIILGFIVSYSKELNIKIFFLGTLFILITISLNVLAKKIAAYYFDSEIEIKIWQLQHYGFKPDSHFKKPVPIGIFTPIVFLFISLGNLKWLASLTFDVKAKVYRAAKRHGLYSYSEMTEWHIGLIAASGIFINLVAALVFYLINIPDLSRLNIYYAFFNMIPFSDLDGNKILFGSLILWSFLAILTLIAVGYALLL